jgi:hypothetical protein
MRVYRTILLFAFMLNALLIDAVSARRVYKGFLKPDYFCPI